MPKLWPRKLIGFKRITVRHHYSRYSRNIKIKVNKICFIKFKLLLKEVSQAQKIIFWHHSSATKTLLTIKPLPPCLIQSMHDLYPRFITMPEWFAQNSDTTTLRSPYFQLASMLFLPSFHAYLSQSTIHMINLRNATSSFSLLLIHLAPMPISLPSFHTLDTICAPNP